MEVCTSNLSSLPALPNSCLATSADRLAIGLWYFAYLTLCCAFGDALHQWFSCLQDLADKIAQLNSAIDDVSSQLKASDSVVEEASLTG